MILVADPKIFEGPISRSIVDILYHQEKVNNGRGTVKYPAREDFEHLLRRFRSSFTVEMRVLVAVLNGRMRPNESVGTILVNYGDEAGTFTILYYVLNGTPGSAFLDFEDMDI
jgi:hypothetical protein